MAHNTWLMPEHYQSPKPHIIKVSFVTSEHFPHNEYKTSPQRVAEWIVRCRDVQTKVEDFTLADLDLSADVRLEREGTHVIAARLYPRYIEFEGSYFNEYLEDEHADDVLKLRQKEGAKPPTGKMFYTKLVKTFVQVGDHATDDFDKPVGHVLEIIPLTNPCQWQVGDKVRVRVLLDSQPTEGIRVSSGHENMGEHTHRKSASHDYVENVFTDAKGEAELTLSAEGRWFFRTHFIRSVPSQPTGISGLGDMKSEDQQQADWESFWASITFCVGQEHSHETESVSEEDHNHHHDHPDD